MRRIFGLLLAIIMVICMPCGVYASNQPARIVAANSYSEWDVVKALESKDPNVLKAYEIDEAQAQRIVALYYQALDERSQLPDEELIALGCTQEKIALLRKYALEKHLNEAEMRAVMATYSDYVTINATDMGYKKAKVTYHWEWDSSPFVTMKDSVGMIWRAVNSSGTVIGVIKTEQTANVCYAYDQAILYTDTNPQFENLGFDGANVQFDCRYSHAVYGSLYAKSGFLTIGVEVNPQVLANLAYFRAYAQYGHTTIGVGFPSISLTAGAGWGVGITFSGNLQITHQGGREVVAYPNGTWNYV